jgi:hypothetical protein
LSPKPAIDAATDVTIATSFLAVMGWPWRANSLRATFISASRLNEPDGIQSAPSATCMSAAMASPASVVSL